MSEPSAREPILQANPKASYLAQQAEIDASLARAARSGWYILGTEVESFEREFAAFIGVEHGVGVANGTDAIALALRACDVGPGDLVFTVSHTAVATVAAIDRRRRHHRGERRAAHTPPLSATAIRLARAIREQHARLQQPAR